MTVTSSLPLLSLCSCTPPSLLPLPDSLTRPLCLFILLSFSPPLSSPCLLCFRSATQCNRGKAFYIPHITAQLQSIAFMSAWIGGFAKNMNIVQVCVPLCTHTHTREHLCISHTRPHTHMHTSDPIHLLHNIIRISRSVMTHTAWKAN